MHCLSTRKLQQQLSKAALMQLRLQLMMTNTLKICSYKACDRTAIKMQMSSSSSS
jgi:hypothetical protein